MWQILSRELNNNFRKQTLRNKSKIHTAKQKRGNTPHVAKWLADHHLGPFGHLTDKTGCKHLHGKS